MNIKITDDQREAYIYLPKHPGPGTPRAVAKTIRVDELVESFSGPSVNLDFDRHGQLIGIEILL
jgi:uncharacterized protein YuzE